MYNLNTIINKLLNMFRFICTLFVLLCFTNCIVFAKEKTTITCLSEDDAYSRAELLFQKKKYNAAAKQFFDIFVQHLGSNTATKAELMRGYSLYLAGQYSEASEVLDNFIRLHPAHQKIADVYYLKALAEYKQAHNQQDLEQLLHARLELQQVIDKFPKSDFAIKAKEKINVISKNLAGSQIDIGKFYLNKKNPIAALNRFNTVVDKYSHTSYYPEAIYRIAQSYALLGRKQEMKEQLAILNSKFPNSTWSKRASSLLQLNDCNA